MLRIPCLNQSPWNEDGSWTTRSGKKRWLCVVWMTSRFLAFDWSRLMWSLWSYRWNMVESVILWFIPHMSSSTKRLAHYLINFCSYTHFVVPIDIVNLYTESFCGWGLTVGLHFQHPEGESALHKRNMLIWLAMWKKKHTHTHTSHFFLEFGVLMPFCIVSI